MTYRVPDFDKLSYKDKLNSYTSCLMWAWLVALGLLVQGHARCNLVVLAGSGMGDLYSLHIEMD